MSPPWWSTSVGYQVYIRSFADSNGDGVGDLAGITSRLPYLAWLGVDLLWVTPFYPSPMRDHGYDVTDYDGVDPSFGSLADYDALVATARSLGIRVVIDVVANHCSSDHPWFQSARRSRTDPYRHYFHWRDPAPGGGPPNNWVSHFGGPAWTLDPATGQYWLHLFLPEQPDLNWANPAVATELDQVLARWLARGTSGFRIDVAHGFAKDPAYRDNPKSEPSLLSAAKTGRDRAWLANRHAYDLDQAATLEVFSRWRSRTEQHGALLLGEVYLHDLDRVLAYVQDGRGLHLAFWFKLLHTPFGPAQVRTALERASGSAPGRLSWVLSNHDKPRAVTRYGGGELGRRRALAVHTLLMGLPGLPFLYQGEELGMEDGEVPPHLRQDPIALRNPGDPGRDGCRTPMPWETGPGMGFTTSARSWLPFADLGPEGTVAVQRQDPGSMLHRFRRLVALRRRASAPPDEPAEWLASPPDVLAYRRGHAVVAANLGESPQQLSLPWPRGRVLFASSASRDGEPVDRAVALGPLEAAILTPADRDTL